MILFIYGEKVVLIIISILFELDVTPESNINSFNQLELNFNNQENFNLVRVFMALLFQSHTKLYPKSRQVKRKFTSS